MITKFGMVVMKFNQLTATNYLALVGQLENDGQFVLTLFDDEFKVVGRFIDNIQEILVHNMYLYVNNEIGEIKEVFDIQDDPALIAMIRRLRN